MNAHRDQSPENRWPEIPAKTPYPASYRKLAVCEDWMVEIVGHKLMTHHPVIEPVSITEPGTEIYDAETGANAPPYRVAETNPEMPRECESPHSGATNARKLTRV